MGSQAEQEQAARRRKRLIAVMAVVVGVAMVVPIASALLQYLFGTDRSGQVVAATDTTTAAPVLTIAPLEVRPVVTAEGVAPEQCIPPPPVPPTEPLRTCDFAKTAVYDLGASGAALQLIRVDSLLSPITNGYIVQVSMTSEAAQAFQTFTAANVGKQVAFMRAGVVVSAPEITEPITGTTLQLSGELTADQSTEMARLLRDET
jgi:hypothetical protein